MQADSTSVAKQNRDSFFILMRFYDFFSAKVIVFLLHKKQAHLIFADALWNTSFATCINFSGINPSFSYLSDPCLHLQASIQLVFLLINRHLMPNDLLDIR